MGKGIKKNKSPLTTAVWWDINRCPIPETVSPARVIGTIKSILANRYGSGPVTVFGIGDTSKCLSDQIDILCELGVLVRHNETGFSYAYYAVTTWMQSNPPPARIVIVAGGGGMDFHTLLRRFESQGYQVTRGYPLPRKHQEFPLWDEILYSRDDCKPAASLDPPPSTQPPFFCTHCQVETCSLAELKVHINSPSHNEKMSSWPNRSPQTAVVIWDMNTCPPPLGVDVEKNPRIVCDHMKSFFSDFLGGEDYDCYFPPVTIYAIGNLKHISSDFQATLSQTPGIFFRHTEFPSSSVSDALIFWSLKHTPPSSLLLISSSKIYDQQFLDWEACGYKVFRAFSVSDHFTANWLQTDFNPDAYFSRRMLWAEGHVYVPEVEIKNDTPWHCIQCKFGSKDQYEFAAHIDGSDHSDRLRRLQERI